MSKQTNIPATAKADNFAWIMSENKFMYTPTRTLFEHDSVKRQIGADAAKFVEKEHVCSNLTWAPGLPTIIKDKAIIDGEFDDHPGNDLFNIYKPARPITGGDPDKAAFWLDLGAKLWGEDLDHLLDWLAFKVQHPDVKINHAIVCGSYAQGIGKDSWFSPVQAAVGASNWQNISASRALKDATSFNAFLRKVIVRVSEVHDLGALRHGFYDATKDWCAAPPETLTVADKHVKAYQIMNVVGVIFTTNHKADGLFLPEEDRRHFVAWSQCKQSDFAPGFWGDYWQRLKSGDSKHVAAYLASRDLTLFDPAEPPRKTAAWHEIVAANSEPQDAELTDLLELIGDPFAIGPTLPDAVTLDQIREHPNCPYALGTVFNDPAKRRVVTHRLERAGYVTVNNPDRRKDGLWRINGKRQVVYARHDLPRAEQLAAVRFLIECEEQHARIVGHVDPDPEIVP